eukprot:TRINITY_DN8636_c0_g1_i1.p1 TRINITY_DN8636_c0_g1~~TRINITY_DN8636_c0_g1_i1.p1  ORF type:complete len:200 (+),score=29.05 TRINITY_DN8636_c0_g1_i1:54-602(+)
MGQDDDKDRSRSRSRSKGNDLSFEEKLKRLEDDIRHFVDKHKLEERVERILSTIHGRDAQEILETQFPDDCRNKNGFVVTAIRRLEKERRRPQGYRWDKRSWSEPPRAASGERAGPPRRPPPRRNDSRDRRPPPRRNDSRDRGPPRRRADSRDRRPPPRRNDSRDRGPPPRRAADSRDRGRR